MTAVTRQFGLRAWFREQAWIDSPWLDLVFILSPNFLITVVVLAFPAFFSQANQLPLWQWAVLVVGVDVAHVYATLFRTYWRPAGVKVASGPLVWVPLACWLAGTLLYAWDGLMFWRVLTYLAVFHFIRQQYGFMAIYARKESHAWRWLDTLLIYLTMLYPLIYWHTHLPRNFNWFLDGDFLAGLPKEVTFWAGCLYVVTGALYLVKEAMVFIRRKQLNLPKNLLILGTALSWYVGIIQFNGDLAFTATNVISHGLPYMALVWLHNRKAHAARKPDTKPVKQRVLLFRWAGLPLFIGTLWLLAWLEEGVWDGLVWREHLGFFAPFASMPYNLSTTTLTWLVPLLALPQSTHYILDGYIWRLKHQPELR